ncbi:hypothetical protein QQ045_028635 [Rhodiola kirilowii]
MSMEDCPSHAYKIALEILLEALLIHMFKNHFVQVCVVIYSSLNTETYALGNYTTCFNVKALPWKQPILIPLVRGSVKARRILLALYSYFFPTWESCLFCICM